MPTSRLVVNSRASAKGYGWFQWVLYTEDPFAEYGAPVSLVTEQGAAPVNVLVEIFGVAQYEAVRRVSAGPKTATATVSGYPSATATWALEALKFARLDVSGRTLIAEIQWAVSGGGPTTGTDAYIAWGDGSGDNGTASAPDWTEGRITLRHTYPPELLAKNYIVTVSSGVQSDTQLITIPGTGRAILRAATGGAVAEVDVQQWPEREFERSSSVLPIVGRRDPVVLLDDLRAPGSAITFLTRDTAEGAALLSLLRSTQPLQLVSACPGVEDIWFMPLGTKAVRLTNSGADTRRLWETTIQEVAAP